ncbi:MAG: hypothetical protein JNM27_17710 [Leptospirales bacterium]|nr:hypothetical protein [Leptospirales bacterium]
MIKRIGAGLIIAILAGMLILTFGRVPPSQLAELITGRMGSFDGEEITPAMYGMAEENCKRNMGGLGEIPPFILNNCVSNQLKQIYILPKIASRLGALVSEESQQEDLLKQSQQIFEQQKNAAADDRLTTREIYNRQLLNFPMDLRVRMRAAQNAGEIITNVGDSLPEAKAQALSESITMNLRILRFTNTDLQGKTGNFDVTEEEIKAKHEKEQSIFEPPQRKSYESQRDFVKNRLITEKKQTAVSGLKQQLSALGADFKIEDLERITGRNAVAKGAKLQELKNLTLPSGEIVHLDKPEFLLALSGKGTHKVGPIQDGEATIYVEISGITAPPTADLAAAKAEKLLEEQKNSTGRAFYELIVKTEGQRGNFRIRQNPRMGNAPIPAPDNF